MRKAKRNHSNRPCFLGGVGIRLSVESSRVAWNMFKGRGNGLEQLIGKGANWESSSKLVGTTAEGFIYSGRNAEGVMLVYGKPN